MFQTAQLISNLKMDGDMISGKKAAYKSKVSRRILAIAFACVLIPICSAVPPTTGINNFKTASWNTNGNRWPLRNNYISVQLLLTNYGIDIIAIQEAGSLTRANLQLTNPPTAMNILFLAGTQGELEYPDYNPGVTEHVWRIGQQEYYIYYYDRNIADDNLHPNVNTPPPRETSKQNIAIVSKYRASQVIVIEPTVPNDKRLNVNRPVLGIRVNDAFFFNVHPEPTNTNNESPLMLNAVQNLMAFKHSTLTWMVMGDFNRTPQDLMSARNLLAPPRNFFRQAVASGQATRTRELDYAIVGGPTTYFVRNGATVIHTAEQFQLANPNINNPSDHSPVVFKKP